MDKPRIIVNQALLGDSTSTVTATASAFQCSDPDAVWTKTDWTCTDGNNQTYPMTASGQSSATAAVPAQTTANASYTVQCRYHGKNENYDDFTSAWGSGQCGVITQAMQQYIIKAQPGNGTSVVCDFGGVFEIEPASENAPIENAQAYLNWHSIKNLVSVPSMQDTKGNWYFSGGVPTNNNQLLQPNKLYGGGSVPYYCFTNTSEANVDANIYIDTRITVEADNTYFTKGSDIIYLITSSS